MLKTPGPLGGIDQVCEGRWGASRPQISLKAALSTFETSHYLLGRDDGTFLMVCADLSCQASPDWLPQCDKCYAENIPGGDSAWNSLKFVKQGGSGQFPYIFYVGQGGYGQGLPSRIHPRNRLIFCI